MTQWYVKDLSKLTQVSVQTLHHYDRIGLLKPSLRLPNGYRLYSESDLMKLQQIIALKFFGFELSKIQTFLANEIDVLDHFKAQVGYLAEKAKALHDASEALKTITQDCSEHKSIPWETIIQLIEVYRMTQQLENSWEGKFLNKEQLKEFVEFEQGLKSRFTKAEKEKSEAEWFEIVKQVNANLDKDPNSSIGVASAKRCMDWVNHLYGMERVNLRNAVWEKGFKGGHGEEMHGLSPKSVAWLDQAMAAYYQSRVMDLLKQVQTQPQGSLITSWNKLVTELFGDDAEQKRAMFDGLLADVNLSQAVKNWLKQRM